MAFIPDEAVDRMTELSAGAWRLYCLLARYRNRKTGKCCPSAQTLARIMGVDRRHVFRLKGEMAERGWAKFNGGDVVELFGFTGDINVTTPGDIPTTDENVTSAENVTPESPKCHPPVRKMSLAYKEEPANRTSKVEPVKEQLPVAIAPGSGMTSKECFALFVELRQSIGGYEAPYEDKTADFVLLAKLVKKYAAANWPITRERFTQAAKNYFATPQGAHTAADLASRFSEFYKNAHNEFKRPTRPADDPLNGLSPQGQQGVAAAQAWLRMKQEEIEKRGRNCD